MTRFSWLPWLLRHRWAMGLTVVAVLAGWAPAAAATTLIQQGQGPSPDPAPLWVQLLPAGFGFGLLIMIGRWAVLRLLRFERETAERLEAQRKATEERSESRHRENVARLERIEEKLHPLVYALDDYKESRQRRHDSYTDIAYLKMAFAHLASWAEHMGDKHGVPYTALQERRRETGS